MGSELWSSLTVHIVEKNKIFHFSAITAMTSFVQNTDYQKITGVSSCTRLEQKDLEKIKFREERVLEDRAS